MNEEITVEVAFDEPNMLGGLHAYIRLNRVSRLLRAVFFMSAVMLMYFGLNTLSRRGGETSWLLNALLPSVILAVFFTGLRYYLERRQFLSSIKSSPLCGSTVQYLFSEEGVKMITAHSKVEASWSGFMQSVETSNGVLLYQAKRIFYWLPKTAFTSEAYYTRFLDLLAAKTKHSKLG
jgi:hypothetical protein